MAVAKEATVPMTDGADRGRSAACAKNSQIFLDSRKHFAEHQKACFAARSRFGCRRATRAAAVIPAARERVPLTPL